MLVVHTGKHIQLIDVGVKDTVDKADARTLIRVLVREFDVYLPETARKRG